MNKIFYILISFIVFCACSKEDTTTPNNPPGNSNLTETTMVDVSYGNHQMQKYDIHLPAGRDSATPVILMIHGGAWKAGQKEELNYYVGLIKKSWSNVAIVINDWSWYNTTNIWLGAYVGDILTEYVGQTWDNTVEIHGLQIVLNAYFPGNGVP